MRPALLSCFRFLNRAILNELGVFSHVKERDQKIMHILALCEVN